MRLRQPALRTRPRARILFLLVFTYLTCVPSFAQSTSENTDAIRGVVINSVTREPIGRALVFSPDNRFATMTNSEGRFEFLLAKDESAAESGSEVSSLSSQGQRASNRPSRSRR